MTTASPACSCSTRRRSAGPGQLVDWVGSGRRPGGDGPAPAPAPHAAVPAALPTLDGTPPDLRRPLGRPEPHRGPPGGPSSSASVRSSPAVSWPPGWPGAPPAQHRACTSSACAAGWPPSGWRCGRCGPRAASWRTWIAGGPRHPPPEVSADGARSRPRCRAIPDAMAGAAGRGSAPGVRPRSSSASAGWPRWPWCPSTPRCPGPPRSSSCSSPSSPWAWSVGGWPPALSPSRPVPPRHWFLPPVGSLRVHWPRTSWPWSCSWRWPSCSAPRRPPRGRRPPRIAPSGGKVGRSSRSTASAAPCCPRCPTTCARRWPRSAPSPPTSARARRTTTATRKELLDLVGDEAERLDRLVANLLSLSRIEADVLPDRQAVDVAELVDACVAPARTGCSTGRVVRVDVARDLPLVDADYSQLDQVLTNLLENAARHSRPGCRSGRGRGRGAGRVGVSVSDARARLRSRVRAQRVFEPFRQGRRRRPPASGSRSAGDRRGPRRYHRRV